MSSWINSGDKPTGVGFGEGVLAAARNNHQVVGLGVDITHSVKMNLFAEAFRERFISLGIAEQNAVGVAAGLALSGKIPVFSTYAVFAALRTTDFIRVSVCYNKLHVVIGGAHAGISVGPDGATHQALEDIAIMRVLPHMTVLSGADANQTRLLTTKAINEMNGPVYIRFGREAVPNFTSPEQSIEIGKGQLMVQGNDISIVATGHMVWEAVQAATILRKQHINARVINLHTLKPVDHDILIKAARETGKVLTIEEHQIIGGLGSAVAEVLSQHCPVPIRMMGFKDQFGESGLAGELLQKYGLHAEAIVQAVHDFINK